MPAKLSFRYLISVSVLLLFIIVGRSTAIAQSETFQLDNGLEVILQEQHGSPMVASMLFVKSGAKYESKYENGITHFLEHLLFDGTTSLTRLELDNSISDLGGYINAFTRKEMTAYLVLLPSQYIDYGMTVQADMLFNSIIPADELEKERKVVIEEINRDADSPGSAADAFFVEKAYAGTDYARPVLGFKAFIENIPRESIIDYWKKSYVPSKMTLLVIGDFQSDSMKTMVKSVFGQFSDSSVGLPAGSAAPAEHNALGNSTTALTGQTIYDTVANVPSTYINFSYAAPKVSDTDYLAIDLLSMYLGMDDISPLMKDLKGGAEPLATEASVSLATYEEFSRLEISVITPDAGNKDEIISLIQSHISGIKNHTADPDAIAGIITSTRCQDIYMSEKLHYLGFMIAPMMMTAGWDYIQAYPDEIAKVDWDQCRQAASNWFTEPVFVATVVSPVDSGQTGFIPQTMTAEEVTGHFDSVTFSGYDPATRAQIVYPSTEQVSFDLRDEAQYHREELANGLTVFVKSRPGNKIFAMNVLGKNRTVNEPPGKEGITDFVNRMVERGTVTRSGRELTRDLAAIGANTTLYDNPWIPYDDRYTSRRFSFLKFETIDDYAEKGFYLFSEMLLNPSFDSIEIENVRQSMIGVAMRNSGKASDVAKALFYKTMLGDSAYGRTVMGNARSIGMISKADLVEHHSKFYSSENMILTIVTARPVAEIMNWIDRSYGRLTSTGFQSAVASAPVLPITTINVHEEMDKEQISIYVGGPLVGVEETEKSSLSVAMSILSTRLYQTLREKQGLAYSVGAGHQFDRHFGWYYCRIGTSFENYQQAIDGINLQIEKLTFDGPTEAEISKARNKIWGRLMSAKLSSINQAYYLGLDEFLGYSKDRDDEFLAELASVDINSIRRACSKYVRTGGQIVASAGKKQ
ncbi:MAG: pitrilysin family protein [bacterium]|nr:pitrilysin family protein [bacterium]